jgi:RNA polymerase sigma factor (sigma-70 family)
VNHHHPHIPPEERPTREAEQVMFRAFARGELTRQQVVEAYLWLIPVNVSRFGDRFREDLEQEGVIALYRAVDLFDIERGLRFSTYAAHWLKQAFHSWLYDHASTVRIPVYMRKAMNRVAKGEDVSDLNDQTLERAKRLNDQVTRGGLGAEHAEEGGDEPEPPDDLPDLLEQAMAELSPRERRMVRARYWEGLTFREIGEPEGVSIERVRQILARALPKMRTSALKELL